MKKTIYDEIIEIFHNQSGYARTRDIKEKGLHHVYLKELQEEGIIIKVKHGLYSLSDNSQFDTLAEAQLSITDGILCLGTALAYYNLTTWDPSEIHIAIPKGRKITLPDYPPIKLYYFSGLFYETGIVKEKLETDHIIQIYDKEKTICDVIRYRNKIGIDIMNEALNEYIRSKDKNLNKLNGYARKLRISSVLNKYLEVLI